MILEHKIEKQQLKEKSGRENIRKSNELEDKFREKKHMRKNKTKTENGRGKYFLSSTGML